MTIKLRRIRPGLYETVGHASPWHACTIEEIRPGHECHEQLGTGWILTDARGWPVGMFDTLREAAAAVEEQHLLRHDEHAHAQEAAAYRAELQARQTIAAGFPVST